MKLSISGLSPTLLLFQNFFKIQILYDRIIANRLVMWSKVSAEQTAFQKGKSTIDQIFLLRTIINLAKHSNETLYSGYFDLAKAFDKVSRPFLLRTLIKSGVGASLFYAIKASKLFCYKIYFDIR